MSVPSSLAQCAQQTLIAVALILQLAVGEVTPVVVLCSVSWHSNTEGKSVSNSKRSPCLLEGRLLETRTGRCCVLCRRGS